MRNPTVYLSYTFTPQTSLTGGAEGQAACFQTLDGQVGFELTKKAAKVLGREITVLHLRGQDGEPPLEVVCLTDKPLTGDVVDAIGQDAINYAMESGLLHKPRRH